MTSGETTEPVSLLYTGAAPEVPPFVGRFSLTCLARALPVASRPAMRPKTAAGVVAQAKSDLL